MSDDETRQAAQDVLRCVDIFRQGCSNAGPLTKHLFAEDRSDPTLCPECTAAFLGVLTKSLTGRDA